MERNYKAFISYRHLPLDIETAKKVHRRIERYVIPKDLRRDGEKKLGLVFRDQDELPISSNLTANIQQALDHAEFLIVICSPETPNSAWVRREISYFLEHHDRDHVLAVLVDGAPESSFPPELTEIRGEDGDLLSRIEPLAANIVASSDAKRASLFKTESLRILAALIGCPYDALYRREQRYRRRRAAVATGAGALIAAAFIAMLLNRNAQIRARLIESQINESRALAALSESAYRGGDFSGALRLALQALPQDGDRPYVAEAEYVLSRELDLYRQGVLSYAQSLEQDTMITRLSLSWDGLRLATADGYGTLRFFNTRTRELLWEKQVGVITSVEILEEYAAILARGEMGAALYDALDGSELWRRGDIDSFNFIAVSPDHRFGLASSYAEPRTPPDTISVLELESGQTLRSVTVSEGAGRFSPAAAFSEDASLAAFLLQTSGEDSAKLYVYDLAGDELREIAEGLPYSIGAVSYALRFTPGGDLLLACDNRDGSSALSLYARADDWALRFRTPIKTEQVAEVVNSGVSLFTSIDLLECNEKLAAVGSKHYLYMIDLDTGAILWDKDLPAYLIGGSMYANASMFLALSNGTVTFCTDDGYLSYTQNIYCFRGGYETDLAAIEGGSFTDSCFVLVPDDYQQRAVILRFLDNDAMRPLTPLPEGSARASMLVSPSGTLAACLGYDPVGKPLGLVLLDAHSGGVLAQGALPDAEGWGDPGKVFLTDGGLLIGDGRVLDLRSGAEQRLAEDGAACVSAASAHDGCVYTAALTQGGILQLWRDGERLSGAACPESGDIACAAVGGNGYTLLRAGDVWLACSSAGEWTKLEGIPAGPLALADEKPRLAALDAEGGVTIWDLTNGTVVSTSEKLPAATGKLLFVCEDRYLAAFSATGALSVLDAANGELLCSAEFGNLNLHFYDEFARYEGHRQAGEERLILCYDNVAYTESVCLVLDMTSWERVGAFEGVSAYLPETDSVLVCPYLDGVYESPLRSLEDMVQKAQTVTGEAGS